LGGNRFPPLTKKPRVGHTKENIKRKTPQNTKPNRNNKTNISLQHRVFSLPIDLFERENKSLRLGAEEKSLLHL